MATTVTRLQSITDRLLDATVVAPNGTRYLVQVYDTGTRAGVEATIQRIGRPTARPLHTYCANHSVAIAEINAVLSRIGCEVER